MDMKMPSGCKGFKVTANRDRIYNLNNQDQYQPIIMKRNLESISPVKILIRASL